MATGKTTQAVDRVTPKQTGGLRIVFSVSAADETAIALTAKADNDYITKKIFNDNNSNIIRPDPIPITAHASVTPLSISYTGDVNTTDYILRRLSDGWNNRNVQVAFDGSTFTISGEDDGSGKWAEDYVFQILP